MTSRNYFRTPKGIFFFNDSSVESTNAAFTKARETSFDIAVYRVPLHAGSWDRAQVIGHRRRGEILQDIHNTPFDQIDPDTDEPTLNRLGEELKQLDSQYLDAGRVCVPPQAVVAA